MPKYAFVGSEIEREGSYHPLKLDQFGQTFEVPEDVAADLCSQNAPHLPAKDFAAIGFTAEELKKYPNRRLQQDAPDSVKAKIARALKAWHDYRAASGQESTAEVKAEIPSEGE